MSAWFDHLEQSNFCYKNYPILIDATGRDCCPCGWKDRYPKSPPQRKGMTFGQVMEKMRNR